MKSNQKERAVRDQAQALLPGPRIAVVGTTGSGKTTTARHLAALLGLPHIELDAIHWLPNWVEVEREAFRQQVTEAIAGPAWVVDGNYSKASDLIWKRATTLVWLDYDLPVIFWQLLNRTVKRVVSREVLWNGNREDFRKAFFSRESLFLWALQSQPKQRKTYPQRLVSPEYAHLQVLHFRKRSETARWLAEIEKDHPAKPAY